MDAGGATAETLRELLASGAFARWLNLRLLAHDPDAGTVTLEAPWRPEFERGEGTRQWHGGAIAALIDVTGDFALVARLGRGIPTIDLRVDFLRPAIDTHLFAQGRTIKLGRSIGLADVTVHDGRGRIVAVGRGNYSTVRTA